MMFELKYPVMEEAGADPAPGGEDSVTPSETSPQSSDAPSDWRSSLPPELRDSPSLKDVPDVATLAKNYESTKAMIGNSIRLPTDEAGKDAIDAVVQKVLERENLGLMRKPDPESQEAMEAVYRALGRPEDASGYQAPEGIDAETFGALSEKALELGLSDRQYAGIAAAMGERNAAAMQAHEENRLHGINQVKGEWGTAYDQKVERAAKTAEALKAPKELVAALRDGSINAEALRFMDTVATQLGTEGSQLANQIGSVTESTVHELKQRIEERTARMLKENMSQGERDRLIKANIADQERLIASRR